jgi:hypothetical protein
MPTSIGPTGKKTTIVNLNETADIQVALKYAIYGTSDGATVAADSLYDNLATKASPTFTGTVVLPSTTSIGTITNTELGYLDGVTSGVQSQFDALNKSDSFWFGNGSDGTVVITSGTTTLTRDMYYANLSISGTGRVDPNGFRIFVSGQLSLTSAPEGAISYITGNGGSATTNATTGYIAGIAGTGASSTTSYYGRSTSGTIGGEGTTTAAGNTATAVTANSPIFLGGWISGRGGVAATGTAGTVTQTLQTASTTAIGWGRAFIDLSAPFISGTFYCSAGGNGGNGGAATGGFRGGGGGGGGAGNIGCFIYANEVVIGSSTADSAIKFVGGTGGNGGTMDTTDGQGKGGGGAGGQGGFTYIVYNKVTGSMTSGRFLVNASGGEGGTGHRGGQGGASGPVSLYKLSTGGKVIYTATAGATSSTSTGGTGASSKRNLV